LLDEPRYNLFPPEVQRFLRAHRIAGELALQLSGAIPATDARLELRAGGQLLRAAALLEPTSETARRPLQIAEADFHVTIAADALNAAVEANLFSGRLQATASSTLPDLDDWLIDGNFADLVVEDVLAALPRKLARPVRNHAVCGRA